MRWKIDECPDANGNWTLREADGTEHGNTETCIATVYGGIMEQELIEAAPRLAEQVKLLREALTSIRDGSGPLGRWLDSENGTAIEEEGNDGSDEESVPENPNAVWEPYTEEEQRLWLDSVVAIADRALEATKEEA